jgi:hypothetical protein
MSNAGTIPDGAVEESPEKTKTDLLQLTRVDVA